MAGGTNAGAYCCYPAALEAHQPQPLRKLRRQKTTDKIQPLKNLRIQKAPTVPVTQEPSDTEAPTFPDTQEPTAVADSLPSSVAAPAGCADVGFSVENFAELLWCASGGTVYLNGRDTCVASDQRVRT
eukprot:UN18357